MKINMLSNTFAHDKGATANKPPKLVEWDFHSKNNRVTVYIDGDYIRGINDKWSDIKILWLLESKHFSRGAHEFVSKNTEIIINEFDEVWTHDLNLIKIHPKFKWVPGMGSWIKKPKLHNKTKHISMITSNKQMTPQQKYRVNFALENKNKLDLFGRGFKHINNKEEGLSDYMFSVCIENDTYDTYFTEKILDCFMTGTIPVFKGTKKITHHFNDKSIIFLDDINDLDFLSSDFYYENMDSIKENLEISTEYENLDDWIYKKHLTKYN